MPDAARHGPRPRTARDGPRTDERPGSSPRPVRLQGPPTAIRLAPADFEATARVDNLWKRYGPTEAVRGVTFAARRGEVVGILGPNGAGKTTVLEILEGLRSPDDGHASVLGADSRQLSRAIRARMGIAMQKTALPKLLTVHEILRQYGALYPRPRCPHRLLDQLGLQEKHDVRVGRLSGGQLRRLTVAMALVGNPELLFLDEPTAELDPQGRHAVWDLLRNEAPADGRTIILTTHQMEEAQHLCDRVVILDHGRVLAAGTPDALVERHGPGTAIRFTASGDTSIFSSSPGFLGADRISVSTDPVRTSRRIVTARTVRLELTLQAIMATRGLTIEHLRVERPNLEDVFLSLTGRRIRS